MTEQLPAIQSDQTLPTEHSKGVFASERNFELAQRMAKAFASSGLVPKDYQGNTANSLIALELANRIGASPIMVAQNLHVIHGRPSWSSSFIIGAINKCGNFSALRFKIEGTGDSKSVTAWATDRSGEILDGPPVSIAMAKAEGWYDRAGSKWKTMPDLMLRYRAAAFFGRLYAPEILLGMRTMEEEQEIIDVTPNQPGADEKPSKGGKGVASINEKIEKRKASNNATPDKMATAVQSSDHQILTDLKQVNAAGLPPNEKRSTETAGPENHF